MRYSLVALPESLDVFRLRMGRGSGGADCSCTPLQATKPCSVSTGSLGFLLTYSSLRTMAPRSIQPLIEMSSRKIKAAGE